MWARLLLEGDFLLLRINLKNKVALFHLASQSRGDN